MNSGSRDNVGRKDHGKPHVDKAVYVGVVGARLEKTGVMEWQELIVNSEQNTTEHGYGENVSEPSLKSIFANFYDLPYFPTYKSVQQSSNCNRMIEFPMESSYFNDTVYRKRIQISAETFLIEANHRGHIFGQDVHAFVVGLGLGVWQYTSKQVYDQLVNRY